MNRHLQEGGSPSHALNGRSLLVLDCEIKAMVPKQGEDRIPNAVYCAGWHDKLGMGVSVCGVRDLETMDSRVFLDDNALSLDELAADRGGLVTFNGINFDVPLIEACWAIDLSRLIQIDLKEMVAEALGLDARRYQKGYTLDGLLAANGMPPKPGDSVLAPLQWQRRETGRVIDKCLGDVARTLDLLQAALKAPLVDPNGGPEIDIRPALHAAIASAEERAS